jgi:TolB-like protein/predicted Zn-dependent protease
VRINARLIDALQGNHIWAEDYDRKFDDLFALQDDITHNVAVALQVELTIGEEAQSRGKGTPSAEAFLLSHKALWHLRKFNREDVAKAGELIRQAREISPDALFPLQMEGWVHLADARYGWSAPKEELLQKAEEIAKMAMAMDERDPDSNLLLAGVHRGRRELDQAIRYVERSVELNPNHAGALGTMGQVLNYAGRPREAISAVKRAMRLSPYYPAFMAANLGLSYMMIGEYDKAIAAYEEVLERNALILFSYERLTAIYALKGDMAKARKHAARVLELKPDFTVQGWSKALFYTNQEDMDRELNALRLAGLPEKPPLALPDKPSIAVLPFTNMSGDPEQDYFADGMSEDLITDLSKISGLFVIARNSSFAYKGKAVDVKRVSRELGVRYVLEGSVRRAGAQVRINAQLIDTTTGGHLWAERYDGTLDDVFALQDRVAERVVQALELHLTERDRARRGEEPRTGSLEAYDLVLQARKLMTRFDRKAASEARDLLERAIELDPRYAEAYSLLGLYYFDGWRLWGESRDKNLARALDLGRTSVELSPFDPAPHVLLAQIHQFRREFDAANVEADAALALEPNDAITLANLGSMLRFAHRAEEAVAVVERAIRLDPYHPPNYLEWLGDTYFLLGRYDDCVRAANRGVALDPDFVGLRVTQAQCYAALGNETKAQDAAAKVLRANPRFTLRAFASYVPFRDERDLQRNIEMLRKAGLPE